jgi:hypothetical protein
MIIYFVPFSPLIYSYLLYAHILSCLSYGTTEDNTIVPAVSWLSIKPPPSLHLLHCHPESLLTLNFLFLPADC